MGEIPEDEPITCHHTRSKGFRVPNRMGMRDARVPKSRADSGVLGSSHPGSCPRFVRAFGGCR